MSPSRAASSGRRLIGHAAARRQDVQLAVVQHELEHAFDGGLGGTALEGDLEAQAAGLGVQRFQRGQRVGKRGHVHDAAQRVHVAQERQRVHAVLQHAGAEAQRDVPVVGAAAGADAAQRGLGLGLGLRCGCRLRARHAPP
jgi:hypothetical protein